ncbi:hypothetical protein SAMN02910293_00999 [Streptococcus henryi]|uniref:Uncharacterized protein n=1 Tax=Streptococcus henryi TaxID=439219 RepID=A0A1G6BFF6_9STRE|nr:hypothetical protein SAMN02910293_00999 [Streptococcus henryi]
MELSPYVLKTEAEGGEVLSKYQDESFILYNQSIKRKNLVR